MAQPEESLDLAAAALLIAQEEYGSLDVPAYLQRLDTLAESLRARMPAGKGAYATLGALNRYLFEEEGFRGNVEDYYDPRNSFLNEVLDRKTGIPISLSTVYMEVAGRLALPVAGVGFPGHFLVKYVGEGEEILLDPFNRGAFLSEGDCQERIQRMYDGRMAFHPDHLAAVTKKEILVRMLNNLKGIYLSRQDFRRALAAVDRIMIIAPDELTQRRDRGLICAQLKRFPEAAAELERVLRASPDGEDKDSVKDQLRSIRAQMSQWN